MVIMRSHDRIAYILNGVCTYYDMTLPQLRSICRKKWLNRRRITMKLLYDVAEVRLKEIPSAIGYAPSLISNISVHINELNEEMRNGTKEGKALKQEYEAILKHLNL